MSQYKPIAAGTAIMIRKMTRPFMSGVYQPGLQKVQTITLNDWRLASNPRIFG
jgi:hypothetical protein